MNLSTVGSFLRGFWKINKTDLLNLIGFLVWLILFLCFPVWIQTGFGQTLYEELLEHLSFIKLFTDAIEDVTGYVSALPSLEAQTTALSLFKILLSSSVKGILFCLCSLLFSSIYKILGAVDLFTSRTAWIDAAEGILNSAGYASWVSLVNIFITAASQILVTAVMNLLDERLAALSTAEAAAVAVMVCVALFLIYSLTAAWREKREIEYGILRTYLVNILPEMLTLLVINSLLFAVFAAAVNNGFCLLYAIFFVLLVLCTGLMEFVRKVLTQFFVWLTGFGKKGTLSLLSAFFLFGETVLATVAMYPIAADTAIQLSDENLAAFPLLQGLMYGMSLSDAIEYGVGDPWTGLMLLMLSCLITAWLLKRPPLKITVFWMLFWVPVTLGLTAYAVAGLRWLFLQDALYWLMVLLFLAVILIAACRNFWLLLAAAGAAVCLLLAYRGIAANGFMLYEGESSGAYLSKTCVTSTGMLCLAGLVHFLRNRIS